MQFFAADRRRRAAEIEAGEGVVAEVPRREVEKQRCGERAVDDEAAVALFFGRIRQVVVDAVAVESQRRVAEQQRLRRHKHPVRVPARGIEAALARRRRGRWGAGVGWFAEDDRLDFADVHHPFGMYFMCDIDKNESARRSLLFRD